MTALDTARIAVAMHVDPMAVLEWPPDIRTAVVRVLNRTDRHLWADDIDDAGELWAAFAPVAAAMGDGDG